MNDETRAQTPQDETITCCDCGSSFIWSAGEQKYFLSKHLSPPRRCPKCRRRRRLTLNPDPTTLDETLRRTREEFRRW